MGYWIWRMLRIKNERVLPHHQQTTDFIYIFLYLVFHIVHIAWHSNTKMSKWQNKHIVIQFWKTWHKCFDIFCAKSLKLSICGYFCEWKKKKKKKSLAPPDSYFAIIIKQQQQQQKNKKQNKTKQKKHKKKTRKNNNNIRSLHKIMEEIYCTKMKISLAPSLFSNTKSEEQGINVLWPFSLFYYKFVF